MKTIVRIFVVRTILVVATLAITPLHLSAQAKRNASEQPQVLIRCDDIGMCHTVNTAIKEVLDTGLPISASVMFACPWYQEAVDILKSYKNVSVGIHLTLNAEWKTYRWGPVAGRSAVPSLVDNEGFFFPSRALLFANNPTLDDIERELRAQIERAVRSGLTIDYVDYHMGAAVQTIATREVVEKLAREYHLGISRYFGEVDVEGWYSSPIESKKDTLLKRVHSLAPGAMKLFVFHIGQATPEMNALIDLNPFGPKDMSRHRQAELQALVSAEFRSLLLDRNVLLKTYADLKKEIGIGNMKRPPLE
jgi:chitin disaccharide deacetylase